MTIDVPSRIQHFVVNTFYCLYIIIDTIKMSTAMF